MSRAPQDLFSQRTHWDTDPSDLAQAWNARRASGLPAYDLTVSNATAADFAVDLAAVGEALRSGSLLAYDPVPFGLLAARSAVSDYYAQQHDVEVSLDNIALTVSTSEAYSYLFRLLCDPGDEVLFLQPSYPLFDFLAELDKVCLKAVGWLRDHDGWHLDRTGLEQALTGRTRAVLLVNPNNPTGHFPSSADAEWLTGWCATHSLSLIVDEVFLDYGFSPASFGSRSFLAQDCKCLTFVLSGISKISGLPQMKVAWIVAHGPSELTREALRRLDVIADTFLSVSTPLQAALPALLDVRKQIQPQIMRRLHDNLTTLDQLLVSSPRVTRAPIQGGWYAAVRVPALEPAEMAAVRLVRDAGVYVHPGSFFGYATAGIWVVSLLTQTAVFTEGIGELLRHEQTFE